MTPEAKLFLDKAHLHLEHSAAMLRVELNEDAGRTAYLAGFHAAQAFIFESVGRVFKSHRGVQTEFLRLTKDDPRFTSDHRIFLSQTYNLKAIADYETGPGANVSAERAARALEAGRRFVSQIASVLSPEIHGDDKSNF
ncbi:MAG: HEPN domain-containing protein [Methylocystaceae bacterium]|nr:MAG: HEPN domain-containing protein [Methylocystaceae bacterium]